MEHLEGNELYTGANFWIGLHVASVALWRGPNIAPIQPIKVPLQTSMQGRSLDSIEWPMHARKKSATMGSPEDYKGVIYWISGKLNSEL